MHKQDTAALDAAALAERLAQRGFKQYWVAERIGVDKLTVNRWLTGKVRRISRDNLARLAGLLECPAEDLVLADELDARATRAEQSQAARRLLDPSARRLFTLSEEYALYESLLKAVMHPNMTLRELCELYGQLTIVAARQSKPAEARRYAELTLEYAMRCGDTRREFSARSNMIAADGDSGRLAKARRELEHLVSFAESVGNLRGRAVAQVNLLHAYRLQGELRKALATARSCLPVLEAEGEVGACAQIRINAANALFDAGELELALRWRKAASRATDWGDTPRMKFTQAVFEATIVSLGGQCAAALERLEAVLGGFRELGKVQDAEIVLPAVVYRRAGQFSQAEEYLSSISASNNLGPYDPAFILQERARLAASAGNTHAGGALAEEAKAAFQSLGMPRRAGADILAEPGSLQRVSRKELAWFAAA